MKDSNIHDGLKDQMLRDYLSQQMLNAVVKGFDNEVALIPMNDDGLQWAKDHTIANIKHLQRTLKLIEIKQAVRLLIHERGWEEHDVSDYVTAEYNPRLYMNFVGTKEELDKFMLNFGD